MLGETQISDFAYSVVEQNIGQFEISVHGSDLVQSLKSIQDLFQKICCLIFSQSLLCFKVLLQISTITELSPDKDRVAGGKGVNILYNVLVFTRFENLDFGFDKFIKFGCFDHELFGNDFDGNLASVSLINGLVDFCESSFTQDINEGERLHFLIE